MKKKLLAAVLSMALAIEPAVFCQAEAFFSDEQVTQVLLERLFIKHAFFQGQKRKRQKQPRRNKFILEE